MKWRSTKNGGPQMIRHHEELGFGKKLAHFEWTDALVGKPQLLRCGTSIHKKTTLTRERKQKSKLMKTWSIYLSRHSRDFLTYIARNIYKSQYNKEPELNPVMSFNEGQPETPVLALDELSNPDLVPSQGNKGLNTSTKVFAVHKSSNEGRIAVHHPPGRSEHRNI